MNRHRFEEICRESRLRPVGRVDVPGGVILLADGYMESEPDRQYPHYKTLWAHGRNEDHLDVAQCIYNDGTLGSSTLDQRIAEATSVARQAIEARDRGR
jgi:hypothetical protein